MPSTTTTVGPPARIIALMNQKGGVGKTTTTVNLGHAVALAGRRVCLIDMDPQSHLSLHLGLERDAQRPSVYDVLIDPQCAAADAIINARENLDVLPSETDLAGAESELAGAADRQRVLSRKFAPLAGRYDLVLIDCPPSLGLLTLNALALAREVFVPMQAHFLALQGVGKLLETVGLVCKSVNPQLRVTGIILCMHESQTTLAREVVTDLDQFFEQSRGQDVPWRSCRVLRPVIRRSVKLAEAPSFGQTIFDYAGTSPGADEYAALSQRLLERPEPAPKAAPPAQAPPPPSPKRKPAATVEVVARPVAPAPISALAPAPVASVPAPPAPAPPPPPAVKTRER